MIKIVGIVMIMLCTTMIGMQASDKLRKRKESCMLIIEMMNRIEIMIRYRNLNVYEIVNELQGNETLSTIGFIKKLPKEFGSGVFGEIWREAVIKDNDIGEDEKRLLISFGDEFGTSDIEGQLSAIKLLSENLKIIENKRRSEYEKKGKLYRSLGILTGIMAVIIII